jgi:hypothetical protein
MLANSAAVPNLTDRTRIIRRAAYSLISIEFDIRMHRLFSSSIIVYRFKLSRTQPRSEIHDRLYISKYITLIIPVTEIHLEWPTFKRS